MIAIERMRTYEDKITGIIIAGGKSTRMGRDKALINFKGKKLIEYAIDLLKAFTNNVIISANENKYAGYGFPVVADNFPDLGPLSGLESALRQSETRNNIVVPCDTPFLNAGLYEDLLRYSVNYDAVVPVSKGGNTEPLIAFYSKEILPVIDRQIKNQDYKMQNLLKAINTKFLLVENSDILSNLNTVSDLNKSREK